jgi:hypothetical protein
MKKAFIVCGTIIAIGGLLMIFNLGGVSGCGGGGGGGGGEIETGTGTGAATTDILTAFGAADGAATDAIGVALAAVPAALEVEPVTKDTAVDEVGTCESSGEFSVTGDVTRNATGATFDLQVELTDCDGLNGSIDVNGTLTGGATGNTFDLNFDGEIGGFGCLLDLTDLTASAFVTSDSTTATVDGSLQATCTEDSETATVACAWSDVNTEDVAALVAGCTCNGSADFCN